MTRLIKLLQALILAHISLKICMHKTSKDHYSHQDLILKLILKANRVPTKCFITLQQLMRGSRYL